MQNPVKELIPPEEESFLKSLEQRKNQLIQLLQYKQSCLKLSPEGGLRIILKKDNPQYYLRNTKDKTPSEKYISKKNLSLIQRLAQKYYDYRIIPLIKQQIKWISKIEQTHPPHLADIFDSLGTARQNLVTPVTLSDKQYSEKWLDIKYIQKPFSPDSPEYFSNRGEQVRSKSEIMLANELHNAGIPYRYEFPVELHLKSSSSQKITLYPDFYCLNLATRQEIIWEHLGMCDSEEYSVKALSRLTLYQQNGWIPGKNLILTFETKNSPLTIQTIRKTIGFYFD